MAVNMKLGIDVGAFKAGIADANAQIKSFDAQLKVAENSIKKYGGSETDLINKTNVLTGKLETQRQMVKQYEQALKDMDAHSVDPLTRDYQLMQAAMLNVQAAMMETEAALDGLSGSQAEAAQTADQLTQSMNGINKKVSLEQVRSGIGAITDGLENAARRAVDFGEKLFSVIMDSAAQADDISTMATRLGLTDEQVQQMIYVAGEFEAPVETMAKTWKKVKMNMTSDSEEIVEGFKKLGVATHEMIGSAKYGGQLQGAARDYMDVFWETGEALMKLTDASEQERLAQQLLGRSWDELIPLFTKGRKAYEDALAVAPTASEDAVESAAALSDRVKQLEQSWDTLKLEVVGAVAPALQQGADALAKVLDSVTAYLQTDEGQQLLEKMGTAVSDLFSDLGNISTEDVVNNVTAVINGLTGGLEWLYNNWEGVKNALGWIIGGWAALEIGGGILDIVKVVTGLGDLIGIGSAGKAVGAAWGSGLAEGIMAAAPWLAGLLTLLVPSNTGNNDLLDTGGGMTNEGWMDFFQQRQRYSEHGEVGRWVELINEAGEIVEASAQLWDDIEGIQALARYASSGNKEKLAEELQALGYVLKTAYEEPQTEALEGAGTHAFGQQDRTVYRKDRKTGKLILNDEPAEVWVKPKASITFNEDLLKQLGPFVIPANVAIVGVEGLSGVQMNSALSGMGFGRGGNPSAGITPANFSSNLYVENMNMNNGMDAAGLAAKIAAAQRRISSGFGN